MNSKSENVNVQTLSIPKEKILFLGLFLALVAIPPLFLHTQWFTGPLVNAVLLLCFLFVGRSEAIFLGLVPSTIALSTGILPAPLAPMVPFIMVSNALYVLTFSLLYKKNFLFAVGVASVLKFLFLVTVSTFLLKNLLADGLFQKVVMMMSWPQLITALIGGVIAYGIFRFLQKEKRYS